MLIEHRGCAPLVDSTAYGAHGGAVRRCASRAECVRVVRSSAAKTGGSTGEIASVDLRCPHCGEPMHAGDVELLPGPGAAA